MAEVASKYERGKPMVENEAALGVACRRLHDYYMDVSNRPFPHTVKSIMVYFGYEQFKNDGQMFTVQFDDIFDMLNFRELDASLMRCFAL